MNSGIVQLMDDLGNALSTDKDMLMMGGGNPSHIPEVQQFFHDKMQRILDRPAEFAHMIGDYDSPQGENLFLEAIAELLNTENGWNLSYRNVALTAGSQAGFFLLFNIFGGKCTDDVNRQILLPMAPEYIGYSDVGLSDEEAVMILENENAIIEYISEQIFAPVSLRLSKMTKPARR